MDLLFDLQSKAGRKMALTEEQRKRMEENRNRAMEIKKRKEIEKDDIAIADGGFFVAAAMPRERLSQQNKRKVGGDGLAELVKDRKPSSKKVEIAENIDSQEDESVEDFELNASAYISQTEAQKLYCLPKGTIDVMSFIERDNPHQRGWSKMKLYSRSEVRRRARKRFGGKDGLIAERERRKKKKYEKELQEVKKNS